MILNLIIIFIASLILLLPPKKMKRIKNIKNNNRTQTCTNDIFELIRTYKPYRLFDYVKKPVKDVTTYEIIENKNYDKIYNFNNNKDSKHILRDVDEIMNNNLPVN